MQRFGFLFMITVAAMSMTACEDTEPAIDAPFEIPTTVTDGLPDASIHGTTIGRLPPDTPSIESATLPTGPSGEPIDPPLVTLAYERIDAHLPFPVFMTPMPGSDLSVIATKGGRLWLYDGIDVRGEAYLDIADRVRDDRERGLLGVAFSPDYAHSGRLFVHYTGTNGDTVLAEFSADGLVADASSETIVFRLGQPAANHNGGMIEFGPDGSLFMGLGDGGRSNDAFDNGQNEATPLGALLKFDVSVAGVAVPAQGNPFEAPEVWSIGLRNPWRFTIDPPSGLILIGDVGQNNYEEISAAVLTDAGVNYGWPITEGLHCFRPSRGCDVEGLTLPVWEVAHGDAGTCSITGGVVYRGQAIPELVGHYLFSDFCGGYLRSFPVQGGFDVAHDWTDEVGDAGRVTSFGTDPAGEVYVLTSGGDIFRIVAVRG